MRDADMFDRLMAAKPFKVFNPFYRRHKEQLLYVFFGGLTTLVSLGSFWLADVVLDLNEHIANTISWILAVAFAFVTNRIWVFSAKTHGKAAFFGQLLRFYGGRLATFGIEEVLLFVFITWLGLNSMAVKIAAQIVVLILNYVVSKWIVFQKK